MKYLLATAIILFASGAYAQQSVPGGVMYPGTTNPYTGAPVVVPTPVAPPPYQTVPAQTPTQGPPSWNTYGHSGGFPISSPHCGAYC